MKLDIELTKEEMLQCALASQSGRAKRTRRLQSVLALALAAGFLLSWIWDRSYVQGLVLAGISLLLFAAVQLLPKMMVRQQAEEMERSEKRFTMEITQDSILVETQLGRWELDGRTDSLKTILETRDVYCLVSDKKKLFCLPKRCLTPEQSREVGEWFSAYFEKEKPAGQSPGRRDESP